MIQYLFIDCPFTKRAFEVFHEQYGIRSFFKGTVRSFLEQWFNSFSTDSTFIYLPLFLFWNIWKLRNGCIFENKQPTVYAIFLQTEALMHLYPVPKKKKKLRSIGMPPQIIYPCGFFDGATAGNIGGSGFVIYLSGSHCMYFSLGCGNSTNTRSELLALWALLAVTKHMGIPLLTIFDDSLVIISWENMIYSLNLPHLSHWCEDIRYLLQSFPDVTMKHIYHEHNQMADSLSKRALSLDSGFGNFMESVNGMINDHGNFQLFKALYWVLAHSILHRLLFMFVLVA